MKFLPGRIGLGDLAGGVLTAGVVPIDRMLQERNIYAYGGGGITITGAFSLLDSRTYGTALVAGSYVLYGFLASVNKGATPGETVVAMHLTPSGGAGAFRQLAGSPSHDRYENHPAGVGKSFIGFCIAEVLVGMAAWSIEFWGSSAGSNATIPTNGLDMVSIVLRNG